MTRDQDVGALRREVRECLTKELKRNVGPVSDRDSLLEAGAIDSVGVLQLVGWIEQRYGIVVSDEDLLPEHFDSIDAIAAFIAERQDASRG